MGNVMKKLAIGLAVGAALFGAARALEFPVVFQMMFFGQAIFGAIIFMLLDAPSVKTMSRGKSVVAVVVFYIVLCTVYISGASMWPQFDPEDEKGKIAKILGPKRAATEHIRSHIASMYRTTAVCHLANIAYLTGETVHWDHEKDDLAGKTGRDTLPYQREYRKPWKLPVYRKESA